MIRRASISLDALGFSASGEQTTSRRNSFATSSMMSGVTLGNRLRVGSNKGVVTNCVDQARQASRMVIHCRNSFLQRTMG